MSELADETYIKRCFKCDKRIEQPVLYRGYVFCSEECKKEFLKRFGIATATPSHESRQCLRTTHVTVNSSDIKPLTMLQEVYGGYIKLLDRSELGYKPEYRLQIKDKHDIVRLIKDLLPHLLLKRKVAQLLLQYCDSRLKALQYVENPILAPISNEERKLAKQIISLNKSER